MINENKSSEGAAGSRVRWWQEETTPPPHLHESLVVTTTATPVAEEHLPDIGEALEAEARLRTIAEATGERITIYAQPSQNIARLRKRVVFFGVPLVALYGLLAIIIHTPLLIGVALFLVAELIGLSVMMSRLHRRQAEPAVVLTDAGITIHTPFQSLGLIRWDEIKEVRVYNFIYRYVGIVPRDTPALCRRLGRKATLIRANEWSIRWIYRPLRAFVAPINLAQQELPVSADELAAQIAAFRRSRGV